MVFSAVAIEAIALDAAITARINPADSSPLFVCMVEVSMLSTNGIVCSGTKWETRWTMRVARFGIGNRASALARKIREGNSDIRKKNASAAEDVTPLCRRKLLTVAVTRRRADSSQGTTSGSGPAYGSGSVVGMR